MGWIIRRNFGQNTTIASHVAFSRSARRGRDVAGIGFRRDNGAQVVTVFPTSGAARRWKLRWAKINRRLNPGITNASLVVSEVSMDAVE